MLSGWFTQRRVVKCSFESRRSARAMNRVYTRISLQINSRQPASSAPVFEANRGFMGSAFAQTDSVNPCCFVGDVYRLNHRPEIVENR